MRELKSRLSWTEQKLNDEKNTCKLLSQKILILEEELCKNNVIIDGLLDSSKKGLHQHPMMNNKVNSSESSGQPSNSRIRSVDENVGIEKRETDPRTNVIGKANNLLTYIVKSSCDEDFKKQEEDTERPIKTKSSWRPARSITRSPSTRTPPARTKPSPGPSWSTPRMGTSWRESGASWRVAEPCSACRTTRRTAGESWRL